MEFDRSTTALAFLAIIAVGTAGIWFTPMTTQTLLMMVLPSMIVFGLVMLWLGVKHGEHRASAR